MVLYFTKWKGENKDDNLIKLESLRGTMVKDFNNFCRIEVIFAYKSCKETEAWFTSQGHPHRLIKPSSLVEKQICPPTKKIPMGSHLVSIARDVKVKRKPECVAPLVTDVSKIFYEDSYLIT